MKQKKWIPVALAATLVGCATLQVPRLAPGTSSSDVRSRLGAPTEERALANGTRAWYYVSGPQGFTTYKVTFDQGGRVAQAEQVLSERSFLNIEAGTTTREDLAALFGRPAQVMRFPNLREEVWTYRYREGTLEMLNDVHIAQPTGRVTYFALYRDPAYSSSYSPH